MRYLLIAFMLTSCSSPSDKRLEIGRELCQEVYGHNTHIAVRQLEDNQILIHCGN